MRQTFSLACESLWSLCDPTSTLERPCRGNAADSAVRTRVQRRLRCECLLRFDEHQCSLSLTSPAAKMSAMLLDTAGAPHVNGNGVLNGDSLASKEPKYASGLILPPPEIKCT